MHCLHQVVTFTNWLLTETVNDVVTAMFRGIHTCWQVPVWDGWMCEHKYLHTRTAFNCCSFLTKDKPHVWIQQKKTMMSMAHALHLPLKPLGLSPTSVKTSDGETLLLFAVLSVNRQMWRNSWFDPPEILWRTHVKGAYFAINSWRLTVLVPFATNLTIKHLTPHTGWRMTGNETEPHP